MHWMKKTVENHPLDVEVVVGTVDESVQEVKCHVPVLEGGTLITFKLVISSIFSFYQLSSGASKITSKLSDAEDLTKSIGNGNLIPTSIAQPSDSEDFGVGVVTSEEAKSIPTSVQLDSSSQVPNRVESQKVDLISASAVIDKDGSSDCVNFLLNETAQTDIKDFTRINQIEIGEVEIYIAVCEKLKGSLAYQAKACYCWAKIFVGSMGTRVLFMVFQFQYLWMLVYFLQWKYKFYTTGLGNAANASLTISVLMWMEETQLIFRVIQFLQVQLLLGYLRWKFQMVSNAVLARKMSGAFNTPTGVMGMQFSNISAQVLGLFISAVFRGEEIKFRKLCSWSFPTNQYTRAEYLSRKVDCSRNF
ncbi:uncharacterized protein LOC113341363 [Papaver somniferum]|uniref:uncharacterized protein LOC113341363 n=1 Tax=Papaver somniferum TaxID=3469 RepID=UPI000E705179|nr:uncharacterized protein LOC113341363 [Papaver somniferum]